MVWVSCDTRHETLGGKKGKGGVGMRMGGVGWDRFNRHSLCDDIVLLRQLCLPLSKMILFSLLVSVLLIVTFSSFSVVIDSFVVPTSALKDSLNVCTFCST